MIQIYHNPRCGKSRNCLAFITETIKDYEIIKYLEKPPTQKELEVLLKKLHLKPIDLVRQKEKIWIENFKNKSLNDQEIVEAMVLNPILIERPIVVNGGNAIIGRDLNKVAVFLEKGIF